MGHRLRGARAAGVVLAPLAIALAVSPRAMASAETRQSAREAAGIVALEYRRSSAPLQSDEEQCMVARLREYDRLARATVRARKLQRLGDGNQLTMFGLAVQCAPETTGRAAFARFLEFQSTSTPVETVSAESYECIAERAVFQYPPGAVAKALVVDLPHERLTTEQMTFSAMTLFVCATDYMLASPMLERFGVTAAGARCVAEQLQHASGIVPAAAAVLFGQATVRDSPEVRTLVASCASL